MVIVRKGFSTLAANGFASLGFSAEAPWVFEWPQEMFFPNSDLTPINENMDKIIFGLTQWEAENKSTGAQTPPKVTVQGKDYDEALTKMNVLFVKNLWSDGLPLLPATSDRVDWILTGTDLPRDQVLGLIPPRGGILTVEQVAVALAMTGGRPEYMPVLLAIVEALLDPEMNLEHMQATTGSSSPAYIVNGPIAKMVRIGSGYGLLGPDPIHPAGAVIGHAVRLILLDVGGAIPGSGSMSITSAPEWFTGLVFAEDEDGIPKDWQPLNVELGFPAGSNTVTLIIQSGVESVGDTEVTDETNLNQCLLKFSEHIQAFNSHNPYGEAAPGGIVLMGRRVAQGLSVFGWSKEEVKTFLWENSKIPWSEILKMSKADDIETMTKELGLGATPDELTPITSDSKDIMIVVASGAEAGKGMWMQPSGTAMPTTKEIQLPANWDELLKQAEEDLGPLPAPMED
jgi:hypothetical protein